MGTSARQLWATDLHVVLSVDMHLTGYSSAYFYIYMYMYIHVYIYIYISLLIYICIHIVHVNVHSTVLSL